MQPENALGQNMKSSRFYLFFSAAGLLPISLSYGIDPNRILPWLLQVHPIDGNLIHVFRAIMGLYLATIVLWLLGAIRGGPLMRTALISEIVFMSGLAAGRLLSLLLDGWPSPILTAYAIAEWALAAWGVACLRSFDAKA
ncbi:MAG: DUF4345 domain-containing protein [Synechococcaceae cyanobacterium ELA445]